MADKSTTGSKYVLINDNTDAVNNMCINDVFYSVSCLMELHKLLWSDIARVLYAFSTKPWAETLMNGVKVDFPHLKLKLFFSSFETKNITLLKRNLIDLYYNAGVIPKYVLEKVHADNDCALCSIGDIIIDVYRFSANNLDYYYIENICNYCPVGWLINENCINTGNKNKSNIMRIAKRCSDSYTEYNIVSRNDKHSYKVRARNALKIANKPIELFFISKIRDTFLSCVFERNKFYKMAQHYAGIAEECAKIKIDGGKVTE